MTNDSHGDQIRFTTGQLFEIERLGRAIDAETDLEKLKKIAKDLLTAYYTQKAATTWVMRNGPGLGSWGTAA